MHASYIGRVPSLRSLTSFHVELRPVEVWRRLRLSHGPLACPVVVVLLPDECCPVHPALLVQEDVPRAVQHHQLLRLSPPPAAAAAARGGGGGVLHLPPLVVDHLLQRPHALVDDGEGVLLRDGRAEAGGDGLQRQRLDGRVQGGGLVLRGGGGGGGHPDGGACAHTRLSADDFPYLLTH